jgi:hypothetical protein
MHVAFNNDRKPSEAKVISLVNLAVSDVVGAPKRDEEDVCLMSTRLDAVNYRA